jgi:hypothetical protein
MIIKFTYSVGWDFFLPTKSLHYQHIFPPLLEMLYAVCLKLCWRVGALHTCSTSASHPPPDECSECIFQGAKEMEVGGSKMGRMRAWFVFQFGRNPQIFCMNLSACAVLNGLWHFCSRIPLTFLHCPRRCWPWLYSQKAAPWIFSTSSSLRSCQLYAPWDSRFHVTGVT